MKTKTTTALETRQFATDLEVRAKGDGLTLGGHFSTFNDPYPIGDFYEQVDPAAFDEALNGGDVYALWNHDSSNVLARTKNGTLRLGKDSTGATSQIDVPKSAARERESIERGDVDKMSFAFNVPEGGEKWEEGAGPDGADLRTLKRVVLHEVSPVTFPANPNTDIAVRSHEQWKRKSRRDVTPLALRKRQLKQRETIDCPSGTPLPRKPRTVSELKRQLEERQIDNSRKRPDAGPRYSRRTCKHEAAHALAAYIVGHEIGHALVRSDGTGEVELVRGPLDARVAMAGVAGSILAGMNEHEAVAEYREEIDRALRLRKYDPRRGPFTRDAKVRQLLTESQNLLRPHLAALAAVASELQERGHLSGDRIAFIIRRHADVRDKNWKTGEAIRERAERVRRIG